MIKLRLTIVVNRSLMVRKLTSKLWVIWM